MNIRPKTIRRLVILLAACVLITAAGASVLYYSHRSKERQMQAARLEGLEAFKSENYPVALEKLRDYVGKHPEDFDAMYALAVARSRVETANGRHLVEAKVIFEQLHDERPDDMPVAHHLLQIYQQIDYLSEAQRVADEVLTRDPKDVEALRTKAAALARANKFVEALAVSQTLNDADPLDLDGQFQTLDLLRTMKHPAGEIVAKYQALQQSHPGDPRFEMLLGLAYLSSQDQANTLKWLRSAAQRTPPDAAFVQRLSRCFDDLKMFNESRDLLERAAANGNHPDIVKILIERLWQNGQFKDVVDRLATLDANAEASDPDLLAFKALALYQLDKKDEANAIVEALKQRTTNGKSSAWASALATRYDDKLAARDAIQKYEAALSRDRENAVIRCWIGESYMQLGELDLAMQQWRQASDLMPSWAHPSVLLARAELKRGQTDQALRNAADALRRGPNLIEPAVVVAQASYQHLEQSPNAADTEKLIAFLNEIQRGAPGEPQTLPLLAELQARSGHRDDAIATIRSAIATKENATTEQLLTFAEISRKQNLGIEAEILAKLPADASTSPRLALERAMELASAGKKDDGLKLLSSSAANAKTQPVEWKVALAEYLEAVGDPSAKAAWIALGDSYPDDIRIQNLVLKEARSATSDRAFFARTIDRMHTLTGDDALGWRFARARYLLTSEDKRRDSADAVAILRTLVGESPDTPEYRVLLAAGLVNLGDVNGAIDHLKAAAERDPAGVDTMLDLIKLLLTQNRVDEARTYLDRATRSPGLTPANRKPLAILLAQQGQIPQAVSVLEAAADSLDAEGQLLYAELLRKHGQATQAETIYTKLLSSSACSSDAIWSAADFYASSNRLDNAKTVLTKLDDSRFSSKERVAILAHFDELYVSKEAARDQLLSATNSSPDDLDAWRALVEFYIRNNQFDDAIVAADKGLAKLPNNEALMMLKAQATALTATKSGQSDLRPLIEALAKDPNNAAQVEMLKAIQDARQTKQSPQQVIAKLKTVADKFPNYWPLQQQLIHAYVEVGQFTAAAAVVERQMDARPNDPDAAKLAVGVYRAAERWADMKRAAERWRERSLEHPLDADIALAEASLALGDAKTAADQLAPYLQMVDDQPQHSLALTAVVTKMYVATNKVAKARAILQPLLSENANWRRLWLSLAAGNVSPAPTAADWLRTASAAVPDGAFEEQFTVARAWQQMGARLGDKDAIALSHDLLAGLVSHTELGAGPLMMLASLDSDAGDFASAEGLYRNALKINADLPDALNNLAYLLLQRHGDLNEAKDLVTRAIALSPSTSAFHDTLARINEKLDNRDQAQAEFTEALRLDPASLDARIGLSRTLSTSGKRDKAAKELQLIDTQLNGNPPTNDATRRELESLRESLTSSNSAD